ncbi:hypothetical protein JCM1841_006734 [Sporobolomyces salmonicolor]
MVSPVQSSSSPPAPSPPTARRSKSPSPVHRNAHALPPHPAASISSRSRARSLSPATSPMQPLDALGASSPPHSNATRPVAGAFASRPSPVVPPSPSIPATPTFSYSHSNSRPTSPRPSRLASEEPGSPTREGRGGATAMLGEAAGGAALGRSGSQVDLSHIFERDVEFAPSHHISPSEAVDVAVPPVLTEAAVALSASSDDPLVSHDLEALIHESEADAQAGSGWSSPVVAPAHAQHQAPHHPSISHSHSSQPHHHPFGQQQLPPIGSPHAHTYANSSRSPVRSSHSRSFSPDSLTGASASGVEALSSGEDRRAASPGGSSTTFSVDSPPTSTGEVSPPGTSAGGAGGFGLGPFGKKLAEALENEANKLPGGLVGTSLGANATATAKARETSSPPATTAKDDPSPPARAAAPASPTSAPFRPSSLLSPLTLPVPFPASSTASPSGGASENPFLSTTTSPLPSPTLELPAASSSSSTSHALCAPHPRRLSFLSYADVINEERMAELTGEGSATGGAATPAGGQGKKGGVGAGEVEGRLTGLLLGE